MYLKNIKVHNYGPIENFDYSFKFDNSNPRPVVLIGKNGSGKSLVLANIVDSLVEIKRNIFPGGILETKGDNYYKVGKQSYINFEKQESVIDIEFSANDKTISYTDVMVRSKKSFNASLYGIDKNKVDSQILAKTGFSKKTMINGISDETFNEKCYLYFPVNRYYKPNWLNDNNSEDDLHDVEKVVNKSSSNIIKENISENIKEWLYRLFGNRIVIGIGNKFAIQNDNIQQMIITILKIIKGDEYDIPLMDRRTNDFNIKYKNNVISLNSLSSGEMMLLSIFVSIIKEYDINHNIKGFDDIAGICIIDEADLNLHIDQQKNTFATLMSLFKNVQFIITTHSPFILTGLKNKYQQNIDYILMPSATLINELYDYNEVIEAMKAFGPEAEILIEKIKKLQIEAEKMSEENKILVLTEGKTDCKFIKKACEKLSKSMNIKIDYLNGDSDLKKLIESQSLLGCNAKKIIAIFDRDNPAIYKTYFKNPDEIKEIVPKKVYAICLPIPSNRIGENEISIEHYFTDSELRIPCDGRRIFQLMEFNNLGIHKDGDKVCKYLSYHFGEHSGIYVLSGSDDKKVYDLTGKINYSLSKDDYCEKVINSEPGYENVSFAEFELIFSKIDECIKLIS